MTVRPHQIQSKSILSYDHQLLKISTQIGPDWQAYEHKKI